MLINIRGLMLIITFAKTVSSNQETFTCNDIIIPISWVNDDYCDCPDGTDENKTNACNNGKFYCTNIGYKPKTILSFLVNDGVCDCCDGSDEYLKYKHCENNCQALAEKEHSLIVERTKTLNAGLKTKASMIDEAKRIKIETKEEIQQLEIESKHLEHQISGIANNRTLVEEKLAKVLEFVNSKNVFQKIDVDNDDIVSAVEFADATWMYNDFNKTEIQNALNYSRFNFEYVFNFRKR